MKAIRVPRRVGRGLGGRKPLGDPARRGPRPPQTAVGLNFVDVYYRTGLYKAPSLPFIPGSEAAGVVEAVGSGVGDLRPGMRVAYGSAPMGSYAEARLVPADRGVPLPEGIDDRTAAAMMLKGMTAHYLLQRTVQVKAGDAILLHAAAGGVGLILAQWAKAMGATVIGTVGSDEKAALARAHGCDHPIVYTRERFGTGSGDHELRRRARVYDSVGATPSRARSIAWSPGHYGLFGSPRVPDAFDPALLAAPRSSSARRCPLRGRARGPPAAANALFEVVQSAR